jgi:cytochrome b6-f complex iron-sulfur subunit
MKRRKFIILFGAGTTLPLVIGACNNPTNNTPTTTATTPTSATTVTTVPSNTTTTAMNDNFQAVCSVEQLNSKGMCLVEKTPMGDVLVVKDQANNLIAVNPKCTHKGCIVEWQKANQTFKCPCHDAQFGKDGSVMAGPAKEPLGKYMAKIEGGSVLVTKTS